MSNTYDRTGSPKIDSVDGEYVLNSGQRTLEWRIASIDSTNSSGALEFSVPGDDLAVLFPVRVQFTSTKLFCDVGVASVTTVEGQPLEFVEEAVLTTEDYQIV
jgi:hypothetical protein